MSALIVAKDEAERAEAPMHINVSDLTFGYVGREVNNIYKLFHHFRMATDNIF